jgi:hypothetical protein
VSWYPSSYPDTAATKAATQAATKAATQDVSKQPDESAAYAILGAVRRAALDEGCTNMRLFTQAVGPVKAALAKQDAAEGVCRELAVRWLAAKQRGEDDAFLNALLGLGGSVKEEELKKVVEAFNAMGDKNIIEQRAYTETQLRLHFQAVAKTEVLYGPTRIDQGPKVAAVDWLFAPAAQCEYRFFGIRGGFNHATALCLAPGRESFFDPNLGEFEFTDKPNKLQQFLSKRIFPAGGDGRGQYIGKKEFYDIERICCS